MISSQTYKHRELSKSLWEKLRKGDGTALDKLFKLYFEPLYYYGYRIVPQDDQVKDALQTVFFQLWNSRKRLSDVHSVRNYLFASLRRQLLKQSAAHARWSKVNREYVLEEFEPMINYAEWIEILEIEKEKKKALRMAIESLTPRQREAIYLRFYEGFTTSELSRIMKLKTQSVYNLVSDAIETLRSFLDRD